MLNDVLQADTLSGETLTINNVLQQSYSTARKHIHDGMTVFKEEIVAIYDKAGECISKMAMPINNFLKDRIQIESELQLEFAKECIGSGEQDLLPQGYLEENY